MRISRALFVASFAALTALTLSGCVSNGSDAPATSSPQGSASTEAVAEAPEVFLERHNLAGLDAAAVIDKLEATPVAERPDDLMASVRVDELVLMDAEKNETSLPMPDDKFYVSIAPYAAQTHDCYFHSLTTCLGEMQNEALEIAVVGDDGTEILAGSFATNDNGFVGLWLPRDISGTITIVAGEQTVTAPIATGADDPTCVTTLQLS